METENKFQIFHEKTEAIDAEETLACKQVRFGLNNMRDFFCNDQGIFPIVGSPDSAVFL